MLQQSLAAGTAVPSRCDCNSHRRSTAIHLAKDGLLIGGVISERPYIELQIILHLYFFGVFLGGKFIPTFLINIQ